MIDCGADWLGLVPRLAPTVVVLTHAHADHAAGLAKGVPCPVYATRETWNSIRNFPIRERRVLPLKRSVSIDAVRFTAFPVAHSLRAPAVGLRVATGGECVFYVPDVAMVPDAARTLHGIDLYIGDGATVTRSMVRTRDGILNWSRTRRCSTRLVQAGGRPPRHLHPLRIGHCARRCSEAQCEAPKPRPRSGHRRPYRL